jgi:hypothetical protein
MRHFLHSVSGVALGMALVVAPGMSWAQAQRQATPIPTPVAPVVQDVKLAHAPPPAPSPAVVTIESDMPLCSELTEILPSDVSVLNVDCKSGANLACVNTITFYGASIACSNVFVKPLTTPTPTPAP